MLLVMLVLATGCFITIGAVIFVGTSLLPYHQEGPVMAQRVVIPPGYGAGQIAELLRDEGLIPSSTMFKIWARFSPHSTRLQAGEYILFANQTPFEIMEKLAQGDAIIETVWITIPEGQNIEQMARRFERQGFFTAEAFLEAVRTIELPFDWVYDIPTEDVLEKYEGYLFPDTYQFRKGVTPHDVIIRMAARFDGLVVPLYEASPLKEAFTLHEMVTLASIVEKEGQVKEELPIIAGVFYNRLQRPMLLQSCATVNYVLDEPKLVLSTADTQIESPYNTYLVLGLPPGPIGASGLAAFKATFDPELTDYFFFVAYADGSGRHAFSRTLREHNEAIRRVR